MRRLLALHALVFRDRLNRSCDWPSIWGAIAVGACTGLLWGIAARIWMRLISTTPEFSVSGTVFIVLVPTVFGACVGLTFAARQRGFVAWRKHLPRAACVVSFIPFGAGGGAPLMLNVLLATLALTRGSVAIVWAIAPLAATAPLLLGTAGDGPIAAAITLPLVAIALTAWKRVASKAGENWMRVDLWVDRVVRAIAILLAVAAFVMVCREIVHAKSALLAPVYMLYYVVLLLPLFAGLGMALQPARQPQTSVM